MKNIRGVILDAFGTVVEPVRKDGAYFKALKNHHDFRAARKDALTINLPLNELVRFLGLDELDQAIKQSLHNELSSIRLYDDALDFIENMRRRGLFVAICSNLAYEYGDTVKKLIPDAKAFCFSYEVGFVKPQREIYEKVCELTNSTPAELLFIGDTPAADLHGPARFGMRSVLIERENGGNLQDCFNAALFDDETFRFGSGLQKV